MVEVGAASRPSPARAELSGMVAVVGGSSQGIGYAAAKLLAQRGASLVLVARRSGPLEDAARRIEEETGSPILPVSADIRQGDDCARIVAEAVGHFGRLDILVNNDGAPPLGELLSFDDAAWEKAWQQNFMSVVRLTRAAIPHMRTAGGGRIVNVAALSVLQPRPQFGLSVATWAGVIGYAKTLSLEVAPFGITVNTICPGLVATGRLSKVFGDGETLSEERLAQLSADIPLGRLGDPDEIAALIGLLVAPGGGYITGTTLHVDGGRRANLL